MQSQGCKKWLQIAPTTYISNIQISRTSRYHNYLHTSKCTISAYSLGCRRNQHMERLRDNSFTCSEICMETKHYLYEFLIFEYLLSADQTYCRIVFNFYVDLCCRGESISRSFLTLPKREILTKCTKCTKLYKDKGNF